MNIKCAYCNRDAVKVTGEKLYPHRKDLYSLRFWMCEPCNAYVGCHKGTDTPLGRLANAELRAMKSKAHKAFDPLWKEGYMSRREAYTWLSEALDISSDECHIGMFDVPRCEEAVALCEEKYCNLDDED